MSVDLLETIKQQAKGLSRQEKKRLAEFLLRDEEKTNDKDLGLAADDDREAKRRLQDEWIKANREKYGGKYVALDGDKLLGVGKNYPEAYKAAIAAGVKDAFVDYVRPPGYVGEMGGW